MLQCYWGEEEGEDLSLFEEEDDVEPCLFDVPELPLEVGELAVRLLPGVKLV